MEKDIDTFTQIVPEPPAERVSRKGRRSRPAAIDQDIDDSVERASVTKSSESIRNSKTDINTIEKRESMTEIKPKIEQKSGWNSERKSRKSVTDIDDRKGTIVGGSSDDVMVVIPDLM
jgi:hypothetical protein